MALLNALFMMSVMTIILVVGINLTTTTKKKAAEGRYDTQALHMARAGLEEAISWFKRQETQPVTSFAPVHTGSPSGDTFDPSGIDPGGSSQGKPNLGLVREFEIDAAGGLYGRYEVGKMARLKRDSKGKLRNYVLLQADTTATPGYEAWIEVGVASATSNVWEGVKDISGEAGLSSNSGLVWRIRSHGYVYRKSPDATPGTWFFQYPNEVLGQAMLETEVRRLKIQNYGGGVVTPSGDDITYTDDSAIEFDGTGGYALMANTDTPNPNPSSTKKVAWGGGSRYWSAPTFFGIPYNKKDISLADAVGVADTMTFGSLADIKANSVAELPYPLPDNAVIYLKPPAGTPAVFAPPTALTGGGLLVVDGSLTLDVTGATKGKSGKGGTAHEFSGVVFVNGNYVQKHISHVRGQVVVMGTTTIHPGSGGDKTKLSYDGNRINELRTLLENYRESKSPSVVKF